MIRLRNISFGEADRLRALALEVGWNHTAADCRAAVENPDGIALFAEEDGEIAGSAVAARYGDTLAFISLVIVREKFRRRGIATQLIRRLQQELSGVRTLRLHASPAGQGVYEQLGFVELGRLTKYTRPVGTGRTNAAKTAPVSPLTEEDLEAAAALDSAHGNPMRGAMLRHFFRLAPQFAFKLERDGRLTGFCLGRPGAQFRSIIGVQAESVADAIALVDASAAADEKTPLILDVFDTQTAFRAKLESRGFAEARILTLMDCGAPGPVASPECFTSLGGDIG